MKAARTQRDSANSHSASVIYTNTYIRASDAVQVVNVWIACSLEYILCTP